MLTLTEEHDRELRRSVRSARLRDVVLGVDVLPPLRDAVVIWIGDGRMTLTGVETDTLLPPLRDAVVIWIGDGRMTIAGFEADQLTRRCVAQSWHIEMAE